MVKKISKLHIGLGLGLLLVAIAIIAAAAILRSPAAKDKMVKAPPTPVPVPVNIINVKDRPLVTLKPLTGRNDIELSISSLKIPASAVEVTLEYDRNEGVLDAVLKQFPLTPNGLTEKLFLGSKSAGGHITYHDEVIGGTLTLKFMGDEPYALEVPWRYDDSESEYGQVSTADGFFQLSLNKPIKQSKIIVMQSPGAPAGLEGEIVAGPYLVRTVSPLKDIEASLTLRLKDASTGNETLQLYDGTAWSTATATIEGKSVTAKVPLTDLYVVTR